MDLVDQMFQGDLKALTRLISLVENQSPKLLNIMPKIYERAGRAKVIGITGPPGAGKSTLVNALIHLIRKQRKTVAVLAIDPSSPFSGGAVLGDRIRMQTHALDEGVFIRSVGARGSFGGLSRATKEIVRLYDAFGFDTILVETVGVGQTELSIMEVAHTTVVMLVPESGDTIQTLKAGLLEIADIFVVNKSDRPDAAALQIQLKEMADHIPVLMTQAHQGVGIAELYENIVKHYEGLMKDADRLEKRRAQERKVEFTEILLNFFKKEYISKLDTKEVESGKKDPYMAAQEVLKKLGVM